MQTEFGIENGLETPAVLYLTKADELLLSQTPDLFSPKAEAKINDGKFRELFPVILKATVIWDAAETRFARA